MGLKKHLSIIILVITQLFFSSCSEQDSPTQITDIQWFDISENVNGSLSSIRNLDVIKIYGSYYEMGYAHGYLLGPEIFERQEYLLSEPGALSFYENVVLPNLHLLEIPDKYFDEITGLYEGVKARAGGHLYSSILGREVTLNDARALNCANALAANYHCSAFSAWGDLTENGQVITGYNRDGDNDSFTTGSWYIIVRIPDEHMGSQPTVNIGNAGDMNVTAVINSEGVTLSTMAIDISNPATSTSGFTPEGLIFRELVESVGMTNTINEIESVLNTLIATESEALLMSWPFDYVNSNAVALEIDGNLSNTNGYTIRFPDENRQYIVQSNYFWDRYPPNRECERYNAGVTALEAITRGEQSILNVDNVWEILKTMQPNNGSTLLTQIAVIFEPSERVMHFAIAEPNTHAHDCNRETINIEELLRIH